MLYKLDFENEKIEPIEFDDFSNYNKKEKDLENLIAKNLFEVLFEESNLMVIFQERQWQAEADIYAINESGDLIIFELKRSTADDGALSQILRYVQEAGQWSYSKIERMYNKYLKDEINLVEAHKEAFNLEQPLNRNQFNRRQHMIIIGSASNEKLRTGVDYWKRQNINIEFLPYRIFEIDNRQYFEFFTPPFDNHKNPKDIKGVLFDTNKSWDEESIWYMLENKCVAAFGDAKKYVEYVRKGDFVFLSHKYKGIIAAGKVKKTPLKIDNNGETYYRELNFLTNIPTKSEEIKAMPFSKVSEFLDKSFFWARTIKVPYLSKEESEKLVKELKKYLD